MAKSKLSAVSSFDLGAAFERSLRAQRLFSKSEKVFVACSGGPDSVALFHLLYESKADLNFKLALIHFNHKLRGRESDRDAQFVRSLAKRFKVPFYGGQWTELKHGYRKRESVEEAARKARYDFFIKVCKKHHARKVALAHTEDDQAETVLMRMIQGTGSRGLLGIRRKASYGKIKIVRPLLDFSKGELSRYLREKKILFCRDATNDSIRFLRNRIRKKLLPQLSRDYNPKVAKALARIPAILQEENDLLLAMEIDAYKKSIGRRGKSKVFFRRDYFLALPGAIQFRILNRALSGLDEQSGIDFEAWNRIKPNLGSGRFRQSLPRDVSLQLTPSLLVLRKNSGHLGGK